MPDFEDAPIPQIADVQFPEAREPAEIGTPSPVEETPDLPAPQQQAARHNDDSKRESLAFRRLYQAFIEQHRQTAHWNGVAAIGTIMAIDAAHAIMHIGRHHFVRFDIARDLHGTTPAVGERVTVDANGNVRRSEPERERVNERGRRLER